MDIVTLISLIIFIYGALFFTDQFLKSCMNMPYLYFLDNLGITIQPFQVNVFSTIFNRSITKWSYKHKKGVQIWFKIGAIVVMLLLVPCIVLIARSLVNQLTFVGGKKSEAVLQPALPGFNLPVSEIPHYIFVLLFSSLIHEVGHAVAAVGEDIHINGIGFILLFILPGAYVDLPREAVRNLHPFKQLKILCAGVWHNVVLAVIALSLGMVLPYLLSPFYVNNRGIMVLDLDKDSPARGLRGLSAGDVITGINSCPISNTANWYQCLLEYKKEQIGFCIAESTVNSKDETIEHTFVRSDGSVECCAPSSSMSLCFELQQNLSSDDGAAPMHPYSCMPARQALKKCSKTCQTSSECGEEDTYCLAPSLKNSSRLLHVTRHNFIEESKNEIGTFDNVLYLGPPSNLFYSISVTNYIPKYSILPLSFPNFALTMLDYIVKFSGGLGILNLIPCIYLDGYWITGAIIDLMCASHTDVVTCRVLHIVITVFGTTLLSLTVLAGMVSLFL